jgi:hypothetical protein
MKTEFGKCLFAIELVMLFALFVIAQTPIPQATLPEETIKILTKEVHLNVRAQSYGWRIVPNLQIDDLLLVEQGTPQTITGIKQTPANVLLKTRTLFRLPACPVFCPTSSQPLGGFAQML